MNHLLIRGFGSSIIPAVMEGLQNKHVTVLGLGRFGGGIAVAKWLCQQGATVLVTDQDEEANLLDSIKQLDGLPITYRLGKANQREEDFVKTDLVVTSPAVKPSSPFLKAAADAGVPISTEICLFVQRCRGKVIGVTGTKGKSTTTALLGLMLSSVGPTFVGGNIGKSLLFELPNINPETKVVLELSSYMLHYLGLINWSPPTALVTMLGTDHVDWHGGFEGYHSAKRNIIKNQKPGDLLVRRTDGLSSAFVPNDGVRLKTYPDDALPQFELLLPGEHNQHNAQAAFLASELEFDVAHKAVKSFRGLPHRLEMVHESNGVRYYNDSIATIPEAAIIACNAFEPNRVIQIIGGSLKEGLSWDAMCEHLSRRCKKVLTIGAIGPELAKKCTGSEDVENMESAIARAKEIAKPGDVVLLSPGTASYGQYHNFEKRGEHFAQLARSST